MDKTAQIPENLYADAVRNREHHESANSGPFTDDENVSRSLGKASRRQTQALMSPQPQPRQPADPESALNRQINTSSTSVETSQLAQPLYKTSSAS